MGYKYKTKPYAHQEEALLKGAEAYSYAYFMEMGTGKTKVCIDNFSKLWLDKKIKLAIIIAPNSVYQNWKREIDIHCPIETSVFTYKVDKIKDFKFDESKLNVFLMNVEAFSHKSGIETLKPLIKEYKEECMMVIDESTTIKNRTAKRTKSLVELGRPVKYKRILTGSPITKSPLDLFSQANFLSPNFLGTDNFYVYRATYCVMQSINTGTKSFMVPQYYRNLDVLEKIIKSFSFRVRKEDCLDLPDKVYQKRIVTLGKEQGDLYSQLKKEARAIIEDKEISYNNKLTEIIRLSQVTAGFINSDDGEVKDLKNAKMDELLNIIEETEGKVIIWANWVHTLETIIKILKKKFGEDSTVANYGAISAKDREEAVDLFQTNKNTRFFVSNPQTGGYGLTLTKASTVIYFSNNYDLEQRQQSEERAHRIGQKNNVLYIDIIAKNTIDEFIIKALNKKIKLSAQTLGEEVLSFL